MDGTFPRSDVIDSAAQATLVQLVVTFNPQNGQVGLQGPLDNPMLAYGLLGLAQQEVMKRAIAPRPALEVVRGTLA